jgi:hypothetical protein
MVARPVDSISAAICGGSPLSWRNLLLVTSLQ